MLLRCLFLNYEYFFILIRSEKIEN